LFCSENGSCEVFSRKSVNSDPWMVMAVVSSYVVVPAVGRRLFGTLTMRRRRA